MSSGAWCNAFLTDPRRRFTITDPHDIEITVLLVLVGVTVTGIVLWGRRQRPRASRQAGYLDGCVTGQGHRVNVERNGLPTHEVFGLIVRQGGAIHGQFVLTAATRVARPSVEQLRVAVLLADQVGAALTQSD